MPLRFSKPRKAADDPALSRISGSLSEGTEAIELLNENAMLAMRYIHKRGTGRQSIRYNGLLIDVVTAFDCQPGFYLWSQLDIRNTIFLCIRRWKPGRVAARSFVAAVWAWSQFLL